MWEMVLFVNGVNGLTADVRISMLVECYEAIGRKLERLHIISVVPEPSTSRQVICSNCGGSHTIPIRGKKTLACYVNVLVGKYRKQVF